MTGATYQCNYCQSARGSAVCEGIRDWEYGVAGDYAYYRCQDCRGVQLHPFPDLDDLRRAYDISQFIRYITVP